MAGTVTQHPQVVRAHNLHAGHDRRQADSRLMEARFARREDSLEVVRLARVMFDSMGIALPDTGWEGIGKAAFERRLGADLAAFVVDDPSQKGRLIASAAGTINERLPGPFIPGGIVGYVQWVCTDPAFRRQGLARRVMAALLDWYEARDVRTVELHATPMAEPLYVSLGFEDTGPRALRRRRP